MGLPIKQEKQRSKKSITIEKEIESALKKIQSQLIVSSDGYWSLSNVLNIVTAGGLIASKRLDRSEWQKIRSMVEQKKMDFDYKAIQDLAKKIA
jgi:Na+/phosphate symporter